MESHHSPPPRSRPMASQCLSNGYSVRPNLQVLLLSMTFHGAHFGSAVPATPSLHHQLPPPKPSRGACLSQVTSKTAAWGLRWRKSPTSQTGPRQSPLPAACSGPMLPKCILIRHHPSSPSFAIYTGIFRFVRGPSASQGPITRPFQ